MGDYTLTKPSVGLALPPDGITSTWQRLEPMISAQEFKDLYLWGLPLVSPITKAVMTEAMLEKHLRNSVTELELETGLTLAPVQHQERQAFDRNEYQMMGYMRLRQKPVSSLQKLQIVTSNDQLLWEIALDWVDRGRLHEGLVYIVPINVAVAPSSGNGGAAGGAAFLAILGQQSWVPAYWTCTYTTGWPENAFPEVINALLGYHTAIKVLGLLAAANAKSGSKSLGIGGLSQSSSNPGPDVYNKALDEAKEKKAQIINRLKSVFGSKLFSGNI